MWKWWLGTREAAHLRAGIWGEKVARRFLRKKGYRVLGARVRLGRDEIDLVMRHKDVLVFVEVKTRRNEAFGRPIDAVDLAKRKKLSRAAVRYLAKMRKQPDYFRFDVVEVVGERAGPAPEVRHIENAFNLDARYRV